MNPEKDQVFIFNTDELSLIKNTFAENDTLLYVIRKVLLQFPITEPEKGLLRLASTPELVRVLRKRILPVIGPEFPLGQLPSIVTTLTEQIKVKDADEMGNQFAAKKLEIDYLEQQFKKLEDLDAKEPIKLADMARLDLNTDTTYVGLTAYLFLLGYIDPMLLFIKSIAGNKDETPEQQTERMRRDGNE
jgi:hypothetical protein